jgi:multiple sugar transport system permease protein
MGRDRLRDHLEGYLFILPWLLGFVLFTAGPMLASIGLSFTEWDLLRPWPRPVGWGNYRALFQDELFYRSLWNTVIYALFAVPLGLVGALFVAILMNQRVRGIAVFRTIFYLPSVTSGVAVFLLWKWLFNPDFGLINTALRARVPWLSTAGGLHVTTVPLIANPPGWLSEPHWAMPALILMSLWGIGGGMIIFLAGLQGIPEHLYEAANLDGAGTWAKFRHVTLPMLSPTLFFHLTMGIIGALQYFTAAYVMTNGGPVNATLFYVLYLYQNVFDYLRLGYASAMAWILFVVIVLLTIVNFRLAPRWVHYD